MSAHPPHPTLLVVDDEETIRSSFASYFGRRDWQVILARDGREGLDLFRRHRPPVTLLDMRMPGMSGLEVLRAIREEDQRAVVIVVTAFGDMETTIEAMKLGAYEFLRKPFDLGQVRDLADKGYASWRDAEPGVAGGADTGSSEKMIGSSPAMQDIYKLIGKIASTAVTVLITGESGAGKEVVARAIHSFSRRADKPFIAINCTAIPEHLLESELFGHEKGAFTGATGRRLGKFELANHGTLFLDEIADMPVEMQAKLLRVLQEKEIVRVGGTEQIPVDSRIIAATNCDLEKAIAEGRLREDLYHRLKVIQIQLPPLRERMEDLPALIQSFLDTANREMDKQVRGLSPEADAAVRAYNWPGNVRELKNAVESAVAICRDPLIRPDHLPPEVTRCFASDLSPAAREATDSSVAPAPSVVTAKEITPGMAALERAWEGLSAALKEQVKQETARQGEIKSGDLHERVIGRCEQLLITTVLARFNHNQVKTARFLGINRNTLRAKMEKYKLLD